MRLELTASVRKFIDTLDEFDLIKITVTEDAIESNDKGISNKVFEYAKARLATIAAKLEAYNAQLRIEHPEYFE